MVQHPVARVLQKFINLRCTQLQSYLFYFNLNHTKHASLIYLFYFNLNHTKHVVWLRLK
jgi:hypothetical protein